MFTLWTQGLSDEDKEQFTRNIRAAQPVIKRLLEVAQDNLAVSESKSKDRAAYDKASWPYYQSDLLGEQRAYSKVIKLLENIKTEG